MLNAGSGWRNGIVLVSLMSDPGSIPLPANRDGSEDHCTQATKECRNDESTLALKPMSRVIQSPKQRVPVAPQNGSWSNKNFVKWKIQRFFERATF